MPDPIPNPASTLDIAANRRARKWTLRELIGRGLWELLERPLFSWTPRQLWAWRRLVLRLFGAEIGNAVHIHPSVRIAIPWNLAIGDYSAIGDHAIIYNLGHVRIGCNVTISQYAHLCAGSHDFRLADMPLTKPAIIINDDAWVCSDAFVGPGVTIGAGAILGARAVTTRNLEARAIALGNPAQIVGSRGIATS